MAAKIHADDLADKPTLAQGQADDLKIDTGETRYWLCRCAVEDGMPVERQVTVERLSNQGRWVTVLEYDGDTLEVLGEPQHWSWTK